MDKPRFIFLDYLRIYAFVTVVLEHRLSPYLKSIAANSSPHDPLATLVKSFLLANQDGMAGVIVFFLVSGYIITHVIQSENPIEFLIKRIFRIYPIYVVAVLLRNLLYSRFGQAEPAGTIIQQLSLLGDFFGTPFALGGVEWTLRIEILFYLLMLFICFSRRLTTDSSNLLYVIPFSLILLVLTLAPPFPNANLGWSHTMSAKGSISLYFPFLLIGSMIYLCQVKRLSAWIPLSASIYIYIHFYKTLFIYQPWRQSSYHVHHAIIGLVIFLVFWAFRQRLRNTAAVAFLSGLTYSVYLFHNWVIPYCRETLLGRGLGEPWASLTGFLVMISLCIAAFYCIEKPFIALGRRVASRFTAGSA